MYLVLSMPFSRAVAPSKISVLKVKAVPSATVQMTDPRSTEELYCHVPTFSIVQSLFREVHVFLYYVLSKGGFFRVFHCNFHKELFLYVETYETFYLVYSRALARHLVALLLFKILTF